jgi:uncharacterized protein (DUF2147 family)
LCLACAIFLIAGNLYAQEADAILGHWWTEGERSVVEVYMCDDRFCGKIIWLEEPRNEDGTEKLDKNNPDPSKQSQPLIGLNLVWDFSYDKGNRWVDGKIYDPDNGKTYSFKLTLEGDQLKVRGYIGLSLIGRTTVWKRKE